MTLTHIIVFSAAAAIYLILMPQAWRKWALFAGSVVAIYWLQPKIGSIPSVDFLLPTATLGIVLICWLFTREAEQKWTREDSFSAVLMAALILLLAFNRYIDADYRLTPSRPPEIMTVAVWLIGIALVAGALYVAPLKPRVVLPAAMISVVLIFVVLKTGPLAEEFARLLRRWQDRNTSLARGNEIEWLGFSYVAFRLIHTLRDRQTGKLPALTLREYTTYVIFFPAFTAGPIDRAERFLTDLQDLPGLEADRLTQGLMRIAVGIGKKFIVADSLSYIALNATNAEQATSAGGMWVLLYAYAFQIYFDFSGYSDIAIGVGQLFGIKLPENFNQPYLKRNITVFWQSWHMTLSNWVRFYVFSPLSRYLLMREKRPSPTVLALIGQMTTMIVIGLWHGVTWGFVVWGIWHGVGLFIHKVYSDRTRPFYIQLRQKPRQNQAIGVLGTIITFHYVVLGWVWFALPDISTSWDVFLGLFGL